MKKLNMKLDTLEQENYCLNDEIFQLRRINRELQWRVDPFSRDGDAICNYDKDE